LFLQANEEVFSGPKPGFGKRAAILFDPLMFFLNSAESTMMIEQNG
jgi:hypothetical protein